ncbi:MAG: asparagine synthetase B [Bacteroidales bacterium]|nr:asparagine synthetase B [Bacteroidales bacterium]
MCGIVGVFDLKTSHPDLRTTVLKMSKKLRHRGPDWSGIFHCEKAFLAHERLSIVDPESGKQPLYSKDGNLILLINGEIYNHQEIRERYTDSYEFMTRSDCEVILPLYRDKGPSFLEEMNGIFAFALYDREKDSYLIARDHIGIIPLYTGWDQYGNFYVASELKALEGLHSFAIGLKGSPDLAAASKVSEHIGTVHHEIYFTIDEGLDVIRDVIYHIDTYDVTTVRASTPMYLLARVIKSMGVKMVLTGEGADEIFGGYLYFHKAPNPQAFHEETLRKLSKLNLYDCLRANKSLASWGVEGRVPYLDKEFLDVAMRLNPSDKMVSDERIEKWVLRKAFEDYLPASVTWRQKEQFSDGVGYNWIDTLKAISAKEVSDDQLANAKYRFPVNPPMSKEEYYYRSVFSEHFPSASAASCVPSVPSVACSTAEALVWDESFRNRPDPSGRAVRNIHNDSYL